MARACLTGRISRPRDGDRDEEDCAFAWHSDPVVSPSTCGLRVDVRQGAGQSLREERVAFTTVGVRCLQQFLLQRIQQSRQRVRTKRVLQRKNESGYVWRCSINLIFELWNSVGDQSIVLRKGLLRNWTNRTSCSDRRRKVGVEVASEKLSKSSSNPRPLSKIPLRTPLSSPLLQQKLIRFPRRVRRSGALGSACAWKISFPRCIKE